MEKSVIFSADGEPRGKERPRFCRSGIAYTPKKTAEYEKLIRRAYAEKYDRVVFEKGEPILAVITAVYGIPKSTSKKQREQMMEGKIYPTKKPDTDNIAKVICDAMNGVAYHDDSQITTLLVTKRYTFDGEEPHVLISLDLEPKIKER